MSLFFMIHRNDQDLIRFVRSTQYGHPHRPNRGERNARIERAMKRNEGIFYLVISYIFVSRFFFCFWRKSKVKRNGLNSDMIVATVIIRIRKPHLKIVVATTLSVLCDMIVTITLYDSNTRYE